jgi:tetratricopeptide (TPR) repeat protein
VITLGFPLGSRTQEESVNVSVTRGNVRRSFGDLIQIDASLYGGSSGGPMIDTHGKVIGIASGVATERAQGLMPIVRPLWHMGMVLPITKAAAFVQDIVAGQVKWNGVLDLALEVKLEKILHTAAQGRWAEAMSLADRELELSFDPSLVMAAGMMHFCAGDHQSAARLFGQSLSMDSENSLAMLMSFIIDWQAGRSPDNPHRGELLALDWRSPAEFLGYLAGVLEGLVGEDAALKSWDTQAERSWLHYVAGLIWEKRGDLPDADRLLREAVLAAAPDTWEFLLARARLEKVRKRRLEALRYDPGWSEYRAEMEAFEEGVKKDQEVKEDHRAKLVDLQAELESGRVSPGDKRQILEKILEMAPGNGKVLVAIAFHSAMEEAWERALEGARAFLMREGRENAGRLSVGLLEAGILHRMGRHEEALASLEAYGKRTRDPWHGAICEVLQGKRTLDSLKPEAGESPENLITLHTALGLWAEGAGDKAGALEHYKEALASFLDTWIQFDFARERIKRLRQPSE